MADTGSSETRAAAPKDLPIGPGRVVLVVAPSGAGKDAVLTGARAALEGTAALVFPDRIISRPQHASENHHSLSEPEFVAAMNAGRFALNWRAHGLHYGIPVSIDSAVAEGKTVVFNASRSVVDTARRRYARTIVVLIDVPADLRAARLAGRGREDPSQISERLARVVAGFDAETVDAVIDNSGPLDLAVSRLVALLTDGA